MYFGKTGLVSEKNKEKLEELKEYTNIEASIEYIKFKVKEIENIKIEKINTNETMYSQTTREIEDLKKQLEFLRRNKKILTSSDEIQVALGENFLLTQIELKKLQLGFFKEREIIELEEKKKEKERLLKNEQEKLICYIKNLEEVIEYKLFAMSKELNEKIEKLSIEKTEIDLKFIEYLNFLSSLNKDIKHNLDVDLGRELTTIQKYYRINLESYFTYIFSILLENKSLENNELNNQFNNLTKINKNKIEVLTNSIFKEKGIIESKVQEILAKSLDFVPYYLENNSEIKFFVHNILKND